MRCLGIDYGDRWIGLALGDDETRIASPLFTLEQHGEETLIELETIVLSEGVDCIVVGMPTNPGRSDEQQLKTRSFIENVRMHMLCPVKEYDERFTSREAQRRVHESGGDEHATAAMLILQSYFDSQ